MLSRLNLKFVFLFEVFFAIFALKIYAHPHVWVDVFLGEMSLAEDNISLNVKWKFDEMFTMQVLSMCDSNRNKKIDGSDLKCIKNNFFNSLKSSDYFIKVFLTDKKLNFTINKFSASYVNYGKQQKILYEFLIVAKAKLKQEMKFKLKFEDLTSFVAFTPQEGPTLPKEFEVVKNKFDRLNNAYIVLVKANSKKGS